MKSSPDIHRPWRAGLAGVLLAAATLLPGLALAEAPAADETLTQRDHRLIAEALEAMPPQRPGQPDLYVVGFAGDGTEDVFRNEVLYLERLMEERFQAQGRVIGLVNNPDSLEDASARPLATLENLSLALRGVGQAMDPDEDLLLLFITSHGTEDHELVAELPPVVDEGIDPAALAGAVDASGIRNRVVVVSACYSGGFLPALQSPDAVVITAARRDRTSFGCGTASQVTYFGEAWLVNALNQDDDFIEAFNRASEEIAAWESEEEFTPSLPQIHVGERIEPVLEAWRRTLQPGPAVPYPPSP